MKHSLKHMLSDAISAFEDTIKILQDPTLPEDADKYFKITPKNTERGACCYIEQNYTQMEYDAFQKYLKTKGYNPDAFFPIKPFKIISAAYDRVDNFEEVAISITEQRIKLLKEAKRQLP